MTRWRTGEFIFRTVLHRRLDQELRKDPILLGECLGGAMYVEDFKRLCVSVGFTDPRVLEGHVIEVKDEKLQELLGEATFYSITYRLFKLPAGRLETLCEDYGQYAVYKGTIEGTRTRIRWTIITGWKPETDVGTEHRSMLGESWLGKHLTWLVIDRNIRFVRLRTKSGGDVDWWW